MTIAEVETPVYVNEAGKDDADIKKQKNKNRALDLQYVEAGKARKKKIETLSSNIEKAFSLLWG